MFSFRWQEGTQSEVMMQEKKKKKKSIKYHKIVHVSESHLKNKMNENKSF